MRGPVLAIFCLLLASAAGGMPPPEAPMGRDATEPLQEGSSLVPPDWLSSDVGFITTYGRFGYPIAVGLYDDRLFHDEWYPVARSFLDGSIYRSRYGFYSYPIFGGLYDDRAGQDEWYPVARSFLDDAAPPMYYYGPVQPAHIDGSWWKDPRGYRPMYKPEPRFVPIFWR